MNVQGVKTISGLHEFIENETRSYSMDFGCVSSLYVYWNRAGAVAFSCRVVALNVCKN